MKVSSFNTHQRLLHGIIRPAEGAESKVTVTKIRSKQSKASGRDEGKKNLIRTLHVEVAMEIWWSVAIKQGHSAISHFFISVHHAIMFIVTVCILQHSIT